MNMPTSFIIIHSDIAATKHCQSYLLLEIDLLLMHIVMGSASNNNNEIYKMEKTSN
jgi:hypothetical protein